MRLGDIVQRVYDDLQYNPVLAAYRNSVARLVGEEYLGLSAEAPWLFLHADVPLSLYATVSGSAAATVSILTSNARLVIGVGTAFASHYEGQTFRDDNGAEVNIGAVESATRMYLVEPTPGFSSSKVGVSNWSVRFHRYALPANCVDIFGFTSRDDDQGRLTFIDRRREEVAYMDRDPTGTSTVVIQDDSVFDRPPLVAPSAAGAATGGGSNLPVGRVYEYRYSFLYEGRESPPSPVSAQVTMGALQDSVVVSGLEDTRWRDLVLGGDNLETFRQKVVYRRDVTNVTRWDRVAVVASGLTSYTDSFLLPSYAEHFHDILTLGEHVPREYIRVWYTAVANRTVRLRYLRRPSPLVADADVPDWPAEYHMLLVYGTLAKMHMRYGNASSAQVYQRERNDWVGRMRKRWLSKTDNTPVRKGFDANFQQYYHYGTPRRV